jgi:hypothetical protein
MTSPTHCGPDFQEVKYLNINSLLDYCRRVYDLPISRATVYRERNAGKLRARLVSGRLLFPVSDVKRWIEGDGDNSDSQEARS